MGVVLQAKKTILRPSTKRVGSRPVPAYAISAVSRYLSGAVLDGSEFIFLLSCTVGRSKETVARLYRIKSERQELPKEWTSQVIIG